MTYKELEERVQQQGTQCGVNLMSSAALEVECPDVETSAALTAVIESFRETPEESQEEIIMKMARLHKEHKFPIIILISNTGVFCERTYVSYISPNENGTIDMSWVLYDKIITASY